MPPVHTSVKTLAALPDDVKKRIKVVHTSCKDVTPDLGLERAKIGIKNTYVLYPRSDSNNLMKNLDLICGMELFNNMPLNRMRDLLAVLKEQSFKKDDIICQKDSHGYEFYIVKSGICRVFNEDEGKNFVKYYKTNNYFGESAIMKDGIRIANVVAHTDVQLLV